jgi:hypothetical protein
MANTLTTLSPTKLPFYLSHLKGLEDLSGTPPERIIQMQRSFVESSEAPLIQPSHMVGVSNDTSLSISALTAKVIHLEFVVNNLIEYLERKEAAHDA